MIAALVPAKALDQAKLRLAELLSEEERRALALAMLEDVLGALRAVPRIDCVAVISPDSDVLSCAEEAGAEAIVEPPSLRGINQGLSHGLSVLSPRGLSMLLVVLGDVPAVTPDEITSVLEAVPEERGVVISPSIARGTSALVLRPPDVIPFRFGPGSFQAHKREAAARGVPMRVLRIDSLAHDIDDPGDLMDFLSRPAETATHRLLAQLAVAGRLAG